MNIWLDYWRFGRFRTYADILSANINHTEMINLWTNQQNYKTILSRSGPWACGTWLTRPCWFFFNCILCILFKFQISNTYTSIYNNIVKFISSFFWVFILLEDHNVSSIIHLEDYILVNIYVYDINICVQSTNRIIKLMLR